MPQYTVTDLVGRYTELEDALNQLSSFNNDVLDARVYHLPAPVADKDDFTKAPEDRTKPSRRAVELFEIDEADAVETVLNAWKQLQFTEMADARFSERYPGVVKVTPRLLEHLRRINLAKEAFRQVATNRILRTYKDGHSKLGRQFQFHQLRDYLGNKHLNMTYVYRQIPMFDDCVDQQRFVWSQARGLYTTFATVGEAESHFKALVTNRSKEKAGFVVPKNYKNIIASAYRDGLIIQKRQDAPPQLYFDLYTKSDKPNQRYAVKRHSASVPVATTEDISGIVPRKLVMPYVSYVLPKDSGFRPMFNGLKTHCYIGEA